MVNQNPDYNPRIFWDIDMDTLNMDVHERFIIERIFERGDVEDIRKCRRFYGDKKISEILLTTKFLSERRLYLAAVVIDKPVESFLCYKLRQSNPQRLPY